MSCLLRVAGKSLNVDALLSTLRMRPSRVWRKGEPRSASNPKGKRHDWSGASFVASNADMAKFEQQVRDATTFLKKHSADLKKAVRFKGVEEVDLDFGIELRGATIHSDWLPASFLKQAAAAGINVELSHYR